MQHRSKMISTNIKLKDINKFHKAILMQHRSNMISTKKKKINKFHKAIY